MASLTTSDHVLESQEYAAAFRYVTNDPEVARDALDTFCQPVEDKLQSGSEDEIEQLLWRAWKSVVAIAASAGNSDAKGTKLAEFVLALQQRDGNQADFQGMKFWKDLPVLGWQIREAWNATATDNSSSIQQQEWLNLNSWTATLVGRVHSSTTDSPDLTLQGIWTIRSGLEEEEKPSNIALAAAATWLAHAAPALADLSKQNKTFDGKLARSGSLFHDKEWRGYSSERWQAWQQRLRTAKDFSLDERTRTLVEKAVQAMENL